MKKTGVSKKRYLANGILTIREKACCEECRSRRATLVKVYRFCAIGKQKTREHLRVKFKFSEFKTANILAELKDIRLIEFGSLGQILIKGKDE